jgi:hypothetical protein
MNAVRTHAQVASKKTAEVAEFRPLTSQPDAPGNATPPEDGAPTTDTQPSSSWLRKLWTGRPAEKAAVPEVADPLMAFASETSPVVEERGSTARFEVRTATDKPMARKHDPAASSRREEPEPARKADDKIAAPRSDERVVAPIDRLVGPVTDPRDAPSRIRWTHISLAALILIVLVQGGLMTMWLTSTRAAAAPPAFGSVTVTATPAGIPVAIDGVTRGVAPLSVELPPGPHQVVVGEGATARTQSVDIRRGVEASVYVELLAPEGAGVASSAGSLQITTDPPGARVSVDGESRGATPAMVTGLAPGSHQVSITSASGTVNREVVVEAGATASLIVATSPGSEFASGWLSVTSPFSAQVLLDGTLVGTTDTPRLMLPAGRRQIELVNASLGYRAQQVVQIAAGKTTALNLEVPTGSLYVNALPWAEVWIDGRKAGETPIGNLQLPIGTHELLLRHPELGEQKQTVVVGAGAPVRVGLDMRK